MGMNNKNTEVLANVYSTGVITLCSIIIYQLDGNRSLVTVVSIRAEKDSLLSKQITNRLSVLLSIF